MENYIILFLALIIFALLFFTGRLNKVNSLLKLEINRLKGINNENINKAFEDITDVEFEDSETIKLSNTIKFIEQLKIDNKIHPLTLEIYNYFIAKDVIINFKEERCVIRVINIDTTIWSENGLYTCKIYTASDYILKKYNVTLKELNNSLTDIDKAILWAICDKIKINNKEFLSRLFI